MRSGVWCDNSACGSGACGEFRSPGAVSAHERPVLANSGLTWSSTAPGNYWLPTRDENGEYTGERIRAKDPNCGAERDFITPHQVASRFGFAHPDGVSCMLEYGDNHSYRNPIGANKFFANATWDVNDDLTLLGAGIFHALWRGELRFDFEPRQPACAGIADGSRRDTGQSLPRHERPGAASLCHGPQCRRYPGSESQHGPQWRWRARSILSCEPAVWFPGCPCTPKTWAFAASAF